MTRTHHLLLDLGAWVFPLALGAAWWEGPLFGLKVLVAALLGVANAGWMAWVTTGWAEQVASGQGGGLFSLALGSKLMLTGLLVLGLVQALGALPVVLGFQVLFLGVIAHVVRHSVGSKLVES
jgi:hypothetical protein